MRIEVIAACGEARFEDFPGKTAVIIDVLRATSNMVTALANGARSIVPVETVQQAKQAFRDGDLLGGERSCKKIPGFDLGNSPFEYRKEVVHNKRIVMTTTNGTRAVQKAQRAGALLACALLNVTACAEAALSIGRDVIIVCSGTQDVFSLEDGLCAGMLVEEITRLGNKTGQPEIDDFGLAMKGAYMQAAGDLETALIDSWNGKRLRKLGFLEDIIFCAQPNRFDLVPQYDSGEMAAFAPARG